MAINTGVNASKDLAFAVAQNPNGNLVTKDLAFAAVQMPNGVLVTKDVAFVVALSTGGPSFRSYFI